MKAAQGVKIIAKDLEKALAGLPIFVSHSPEETEIWRVSHCHCKLLVSLPNAILCMNGIFLFVNNYIIYITEILNLKIRLKLQITKHVIIINNEL